MNDTGHDLGRHIAAVDYVNGRLSEDERQAAESHLADCAQCRAAVDAVRQVGNDNIGQNTLTLVNYVADLLASTVVLVAPIANQLSQPAQPSAAPQPEAEPAPFFEPLRVLQPRVAAGALSMRRFVGRFGLVLILTILVLLIPRPDGLSAAGHRALAAFVFTGSILALEPVSLPIAALMVPLALVALPGSLLIRCAGAGETGGRSPSTAACSTACCRSCWC